MKCVHRFFLLPTVVCLMGTGNSAHATDPFSLSSAADRVTDALLLSSSIADTAREFGVSEELLRDFDGITEEVRRFDAEIQKARLISTEAYGLVNPRFQASQNLIANVDSVRRYVRGVKNIWRLILRTMGRPEAATAATLQETNHLLLGIIQNQERERLLRERKHMEEERQEIARMIAIHQFLDEEIKHINTHTSQVNRKKPSARMRSSNR